MQKPTFKWLPFLIIALLISVAVEYVLNWPIDNIFGNSKSTYVIASIAFVVVMMIASLLIWFFNRLYFKKAETRSFWNLLYNILSFIVLFYLCFFVKISVISRLISSSSLNNLFARWHLHAADTGAYQTVTIFITVQILFLIYLRIRSKETVLE
jgi:hypothetical protein